MHQRFVHCMCMVSLLGRARMWSIFSFAHAWKSPLSLGAHPRGLWLWLVAMLSRVAPMQLQYRIRFLRKEINLCNIVHLCYFQRAALSIMQAASDRMMTQESRNSLFLIVNKINNKMRDTPEIMSGTEHAGEAAEHPGPQFQDKCYYSKVPSRGQRHN